jgi:hypothetical protein
MTTRTGLLLAVGVLTATAAQAANVRPGVPQLLDPDPTSTCVVPSSFYAGGALKRVLYMGLLGGIAAKTDGQPTRLIWSRAQLKGGEQRGAGLFLATSFGVMHSMDGSQVRFVSMNKFSLVTPYGWVMDGAGLWNLSEDGFFNRSSLPIAPWRNVVGIAPSTNYLYGPNLLWVGTSTGYSYYQRGLYQAVKLNGITYPTYGIPDHQRVTAVCGVTGGYLMVYNGLVLLHQDATDPYALEYTDTGLVPDSYALQSLSYGPNDIDAVAYVGRTLWLNLKSSAPTSVVMPGAIRHVAVDAGRRELIVSTGAGIYALPYALN